MQRSFVPSRMARVFGLAALLCCASVRADEAAEINKLLRSGQLPAALAKVDVALVQHPKDAQFRFLKGMILSEQGRSAEAIVVFQKLTEDFPELPEPYNNLAVLYAGSGQYDKARVALERAIRTNPAYATAHENLGDVYAKLASQSYDKAMQLLDSPAQAQAPKSKLSMVRTLKAPASQASAPALAATAAPAAAASAPAVAAPKLVAPAPAPAPTVAAAAPKPAAPAAASAPAAAAAIPAAPRPTPAAVALKPATPAAAPAPTVASAIPAAPRPTPAAVALKPAAPAAAPAPTVAVNAPATTRPAPAAAAPRPAAPLPTPAPTVTMAAAPRQAAPASVATATTGTGPAKAGAPAATPNTTLLAAATPNKPAAQAANTPPPKAAVSAPPAPELVHVKPGQPAPAASAPAVQLAKAEPAKTDSGEKDDVSKAVDQWAKAWSAQDMKAYLSAYGSNFQTPRGQNRKAWEADRSARIEGKEHIKVTVEAPQITVNGSTATVKFRQIYVSDKLKANSRKTLVMEKHGGKWLIRQEQSGG